MRSSLLALAAVLTLAPIGVGAQVQASPFITRFHGKVPPPIAATERSGRPINAAAPSGRVTIVNLWATWCAPCKAELPSLERLAAKRPETLAVLAVSNDAGGWPAIDRFWGKGRAHLHPVLAADSGLVERVGALGLPYTLVLDRAGYEIARVARGTDWNSAEAQALIDRAIAAR